MRGKPIQWPCDPLRPHHCSRTMKVEQRHMSTEERIESTAAFYETKSTMTASIWPTVIAATSLSMSAMFITIFFSAPLWLSMAAFIATMFAVIELASADVGYSVDREGLHRKCTSRHLATFIKTRTDSIQWNRLAWYRLDRDLNRSKQEYPYLTVASTTGLRWRITGKSLQDTQFLQFADMWATLASLYGPVTQRADQGATTTVAEALSGQGPHRLRRKSKYSGPLAKFLAIVLVVADLSLLAAVLLLGEDSLMRLLARFALVIVPGTIYVVVRAFRS